MKTAEEILGKHWAKPSNKSAYERAIDAIKEARNEAIKEAAEIGDKAFIEEEYPAKYIIKLLDKNK